MSSPEQPLFFCKELESQEGKNGETILLCCEISKPAVAVQWKKGTELLRHGKKYEIMQNGRELQLKILNLKSQDSGTYKCCTGNTETMSSVVVKGTLIPLLLNYSIFYFYFNSFFILFLFINAF